MYFMIPRLAKLAVLVSLLNILTWGVDWFRFRVGYLGADFFALIPQSALTFWLYIVSKKYDVFQYRILTPVIAFVLWGATIIINSYEIFFSDLNLPWPWTFSLLIAVGFPILELYYNEVAPLLGLFHSNQQDLNIVAGWYFDGGITFWWLLFNIITFLIICFGALITIQDRKDGSFFK